MDKSKDERIAAELSRLTKLFEDLEENQLETARGLIRSAAFLAVSLEDLEAIINHDGYTERYTNGSAQAGVKISAAVQTYNNMVAKYTTIINRLLKLLPNKSQQKLKQGGPHSVDDHRAEALQQRQFESQKRQREKDLAFQDALRAGSVKQSQYHEFCQRWEKEH